jgi:antitoxin component of RelBE/YafQ-DinJ toxin-antitoxin module
MKEVIFGMLNQIFGGDVIGYLATFIVALILGLFKKQPKWVQKLFNKGKDVLPDNVESLLVKFWDKIEPFAELLYKKVLEKLAQEMLKEVNGEEANLSTGLRSTMRDVKIELENKVKREVLSKANELIDVEVKEKAVSLAEKVGIDLLEKAKTEIVNTEAMPKVNSFTMNDQTIAIIDKLKDSAKNHVYNAYAEIYKEEGKELEGKAGASITGLL